MPRACQCCESQRHIEAHHLRDFVDGDITTESTLRDDSPTIDVCRSCHDAATQRLLRFRENQDSSYSFVTYDEKTARRIGVKDGLWYVCQPASPDTDDGMGEREAMLSALNAEVRLTESANWRLLADELVAYEDECKAQLGTRNGGSHFRSFCREEGISDAEVARMRVVVRTLPKHVARTQRRGMQVALAQVWESCDQATAQIDATVLSISDFKRAYGLMPDKQPTGEKHECPSCGQVHTIREENHA